MLKIVVCIKQVPMVSELPWDCKTRTLKRDLAPGMMDPGSRRALEAALQIKENLAASIFAITMGPPMAQEILHQAIALGADKGILLTDPKMAGADTFLTSHILAVCIQTKCPDVDLILCGVQTSDSETGQVGPQLAEQLDLPSIGSVNQIDITDNTLTAERYADGFCETLQTTLPALLTIDLCAFEPRYLPLNGIETAFLNPDIDILNAQNLGFNNEFNAITNSPTQIVDVYSPVSAKENTVLKGPVKQIVDQVFENYGKTISSAMKKDLQPADSGNAS
ncbi:MAG: electron transfer flavoprotein subunit beta/FixA family protein [Pseudomonadota bacterium]